MCSIQAGGIQTKENLFGLPDQTQAGINLHMLILKPVTLEITVHVWNLTASLLKERYFYRFESCC